MISRASDACHHLLLEEAEVNHHSCLLTTIVQWTDASRLHHVPMTMDKSTFRSVVRNTMGGIDLNFSSDGLHRSQFCGLAFSSISSQLGIGRSQPRCLNSSNARAAVSQA